MSRFSLFTTIDLSQCFHSFKIKKEDGLLTAFTFDGVQYCFRKAPFGLLPISSIVQRCLTNLFADLDYVTIFVDDVTISTDSNLENHIHCVQTVLNRLTKANLKINEKKLHLAQRSIYILGFCLSEKGLALDQRKVSNILDWSPTVRNAKELQSRLGLANFFRASIPCMSTLTAKLDKLRKVPDITKVWIEEHTIAMTKLQEALASAPVLSAPNLKYDFNLVTDSSAYGLGAALYQVINNEVFGASEIPLPLSFFYLNN
jgi:hypothetical protein